MSARLHFSLAANGLFVASPRIVRPFLQLKRRFGSGLFTVTPERPSFKLLLSRFFHVSHHSA